MNNAPTASSRFLVSIATAVIVLKFLAHMLIDIHPVYPSETATLGDHLCNWILTALNIWRLLALLLLAAWIGLLLRHVFPNPSRTSRIILPAVAVAGLTLYSYGVLTQWMPLPFFGGCIVAAMVQGYLFTPGRYAEHRPVESALMSVAMAIVCLGLFLLDRHRPLTIFGMMPFVYYMLLLAHSRPIRRLMTRRWVHSAVSILSVLSYAIAVFDLTKTHSLDINYCLPIWAVLLQPVVVYPFMLLWRKHQTRK